MPIIQRLAAGSARGFGFGKSGVLYQRSIVETAAVIDTVDWQLTRQGLIAETATATEQAATIANTFNQIIEVSTAADDTTTRPSYISNISETAGISDVINTLANQVASIAETSTAVDSINRFDNQLNISEAATASDSNTTTANRSGDIAETAIGADLILGNQLYVSQLTETAIGIDSSNAGRVTFGGISEIVIGTDAVNRASTVNSAVSEFAISSDTVNGVNAIGGNIVETATISDSNITELNYWIASVVDSTTSTAPIRAYDIALDASGNVYITGLGDTSSISNAVLILKYNNLGVLQWQRMLETPATVELGRGITVDASGNIYIAATYDEDSSTSSRKAVLVKYDSSGNLLFQSTYQPTSLSSQAWAVALDSTGANAYSVGVLGYSVYDLFIAKHNSSGTAQWMQGLTGGGPKDWARAVVVDSSGDIIAAGSYGPSTGYGYALLVKYDSSGNQLYKRRFTDLTEQRDSTFNGVALDSSGNIYCCGTAEYNTAGSDLIILSKFDSSANLLWTKGLYNTNSSTFPNGYGVAVDSDAMAYIIGSAPNFAPDRIIIAKYDSSGTLQWQKFISVSGYDLPSIRQSKIAVDSSSVYVTTSSASGTTFSLIFKLPKDGSLTGTYSVGGYSVTYSDANYTEATLVYTVGNAAGTNSTKTLSTAAGTASSFASTATSTTVNI